MWDSGLRGSRTVAKRLELHEHMMRNRKKWLENRRDVVKSAGYCCYIPEANYWRTPQQSQLAVCNHLIYLRGIEARVEYPINLNNSQCYLAVCIPMALL